VSPTLKWGLSIGILVAMVDVISIVATRDMNPESGTAQYIGLIDQLANVVLFSMAGLRVGRETGIPRAAAEAGVLAGVIAGIAAIVTPLALPGAALSPTTGRDMVGTLALNVAMGGLLALFNGWLASRAGATRPGR
jgi:hypothetical protein